MTTKFTLLVQTAAETFSRENDSQKLGGELCTKIPKTVTRAAVKSHNVKKILQCTPFKKCCRTAADDSHIKGRAESASNSKQRSIHVSPFLHSPEFNIQFAHKCSLNRWTMDAISISISI